MLVELIEPIEEDLVLVESDKLARIEFIRGEEFPAGGTTRAFDDIEDDAEGLDCLECVDEFTPVLLCCDDDEDDEAADVLEGAGSAGPFKLMGRPGSPLNLNAGLSGPLVAGFRLPPEGFCCTLEEAGEAIMKEYREKQTKSRSLE